MGQSQIVVEYQGFVVSNRGKGSDLTKLSDCRMDAIAKWRFLTAARLLSSFHVADDLRTPTLGVDISYQDKTSTRTAWEFQEFGKLHSNLASS